MLKKSDRDTVHINIGQYVACRHGEILKTLLGSCVSACLYDPMSRVAGMNHILLSHSADMKGFDKSARYGIHAMEMLINEMVKLGAHRSRLQAKVFGGGNVLKNFYPADKTPGQRNIEFILGYLEMEEIPLIGKDLGGRFTRVLRFHTDTFEVLIKKSPAGLRSPILHQEDNLRRTVEQETDQGGEIELFD